MVENQYSINTILSFGAKSVNPEILEKLLIGRGKTADYLFNAVKSIAEDGNNNQQLIIGNSGATTGGPQTANPVNVRA